MVPGFILLSTGAPIYGSWLHTLIYWSSSLWFLASYSYLMELLSMVPGFILLSNGAPIYGFWFHAFIYRSIFNYSCSCFHNFLSEAVVFVSILLSTGASVSVSILLSTEAHLYGFRIYTFIQLLCFFPILILLFTKVAFPACILLYSNFFLVQSLYSCKFQ